MDDKTPGSVPEEPNSGYDRLEQQIAWYDKKSGQSQRYYKNCKIAELIAAALVPLTATWLPVAAAIAGSVVLVLEGIQQLCQWNHNWITYRSTCEELRHEKYSYIGRSSEYEGATDEEAKRLLVDRVESLVSTEHSKWVARQESFARAHTKKSRTTES